MPGDLSCEADTREEVKSKLESLVRLYEEGLKKYKYPKHLTVRELSDEEDRKVFNSALKQIMDDFSQKMIRKYSLYQISNKKEEIKLDQYSGTAAYYPPCYN